jgi:hypothetical protein
MLGTSPPAPPLKGRGGRGEGGGAAKWHGHDLGDRRCPGEGSEGRRRERGCREEAWLLV